MSRPCRQTLLEGTSLQSKQTNKERKKERKQQQQQQIVAPLQLPVFFSRQETPWLAHDRVLVRRQPMLHYIYVFFAKNKSLSNTLPISSLSLSALGSSNTYSSNLRGIPVQSSPIGCYCGQAKAEMTIIMTILIIIHYHYNSSSQNRTEQNRTSIETPPPPPRLFPSLPRATADSVLLPRYM